MKLGKRKKERERERETHTHTDTHTRTHMVEWPRIYIFKHIEKVSAECIWQ